MKTAFLISCEHASRKVPPAYRPLFQGAEDVLRSHRGWDAGALTTARLFATSFHAPLFVGEHTRLLADLNRSTASQALFSPWSRRLNGEARSRVLRDFHSPYWRKVRERTESLRRTNDRVIHLSVHSFTPVFDGYRRPTDVGLLFDPANDEERALAKKWRRALRAELGLTIHLNRPYRGGGDGIVAANRGLLRKNYLGFEIEINQRFLKDPMLWRKISRALVSCFPRD